MSISVCHECDRVVEGYVVPTDDGLNLCPWCGSEVNEVSDADACALADALDEACEALFGEDAEECDELDAVDESCPDDEDEDDDNDAPNDGPQNVEIHFEAALGDTPFACSTSTRISRPA